MAIPVAKSIYLPLLKVIADAEGELPTAEAIRETERFFPELTEGDKNKLLSSGNDKQWSNRVRWARLHLIQKGYLDRQAPVGRWRITQQGKEFLESEWPNWKPCYSKEAAAGPQEQKITKESIQKPPGGPDHTNIKEMIYQIGLYEGRPSEKEYSIGSLGKLDVVWKRIRRGNPTHAFEVQIGGDFYKSLAKLKHAFDLWNSTPVLVTTVEYEEIAKNLMNGSFHEMARQARVINWKRMDQLYKLEKELREIKGELRLFS